LMSKKSPTAMRKALKELNISDDTYEIAYEKAMHRILHGQTDDHRELAKQVLSWITFARRPLTIEELQHAVAVELDDCEPKSFDHNNITDLDLILSVCAGLVTIDKLAGVIRLVHHTAQQYFVQTRDQHFPQGEIQIANTCIQYLSYRNVATGQFFSREQYYTRLQQWPLFGYASEYWHEHMDKVKYLNACNFLQNESASVGPYQAAVITKYAQFEESNYYWVAWDFDSGSAHSMALHWAAFIGHEAIACDLWKKGYDVNQEDFEGMTPLMVAARQGHSKLVRVMLQEWRVEARTTHRRVSPLLYAATFNQADVVTVLLELTDVDDEGSPPLGQAIALGHTKIVELLLADPRVYPYVRIKDGGSGLTIAAALGFSDIVQLLLTKDEVDVNHLDGNENTALHLALIHGHREISQQLINDPRTYEQLDNGRGLTDLSLVLESGDADLLSRLVRNLEVNLDRIIEDQKTTPLVLAVQTGHVDIVLSMLRIPMLDINAKDEEGRTALSWVAIGNTGDGTHKTSIQRTEKPVSQRMAILETLLALDGIDPEIRDNKGWSPLFYAADGTCEETVSLLLSRGRVQVNALGPYATTALFHVKSAPIARLLLDARADVAWKNTKGNTPLMHIYHEDHGCHDVLELLCREADLHEVNGDSETVLLQAAKRGDPWMVNLLLRNGAEADNSGKQKSLLFLTLEYAPKAVSDDFVEFCAREEAAFAYDKSLATDTGAMRGSADQACRYRTVIGLLLKWGADKHSLSRLDLLKLKSKKSSTQLGFAD
jgi:ankyrin repeat protein